MAGWMERLESGMADVMATWPPVTDRTDDEWPKLMPGMMDSGDIPLLNRDDVREVMGNDRFIPRKNLTGTEEVGCYDQIRSIRLYSPQWQRRTQWILAGGAVLTVSGIIAIGERAKIPGVALSVVGGALFLRASFRLANRASAISAFTEKCLEKNLHYQPRWWESKREALTASFKNPLAGQLKPIAIPRISEQNVAKVRAATVYEPSFRRVALHLYSEIVNPQGADGAGAAATGMGRAGYMLQALRGIPLL